MSAHFVDTAVIDDVCALYRSARRGPMDLDALGQAMLRLNAESVSARYGLTRKSGERAEMMEAAAAYRFSDPGTSYPQQAMSLHCLKDQCFAGDCMKSSLYLLIDDMCVAVGEPDGLETAIWSREARG